MHDRGWYMPCRVDGNGFHRLAEQRGRHAGFADHDTRVPDLSAMLRHFQSEVRLVDEHICTAEVTRIPAPALHVRFYDVDLLVLGGAVELSDCSRIKTASRR